MRRADRLFQIIQLMRRHRVITAGTIARELEVSERTIYRDIRDLVGSGVPIDGEAGVGYMLRKGFDLPPLMFTADEVEAMVLGTRVVTSWGDAALARSAASALARVEAALPEKLRASLERTPLYAPGFHVRQEVVAALSDLRAAIDESRKTRLEYLSAPGERTERVVRPLGLFFWGSGWSLEAWCELRDDFRNFNLQRIQQYEVLEDRFAQEPGKTLQDLFRAMEAERAEWRDERG